MRRLDALVVVVAASVLAAAPGADAPRANKVARIGALGAPTP